MAVQGLVRTKSLRTYDFCELEDALTGWDWEQEYCQLSLGPFIGSMEMVQVGSTQIMRESWGRKIRYRGTTPPGSFGFALPLEQTEATDWLGRKTDANTVILQAPGREADLVPSQNWDALVLSVSEADVRSLIKALSGDADLSAGLHGTITLDAKTATRLRWLGLEFLRESKSHTADSADEVAKNAAQFVKEFIWEVINAQDRSNFFKDPLIHAVVVRDATDLVMAQQPANIGLGDVCSQIGISLRTLHYAFQDVTGMPPAKWLRVVRLNSVYRNLKQASLADVSIKDVAKQWGFLHYGHFSEQYSRLFGISPVQTLKTK